MREAAFILLILFLLFGLTAFRYRKHIAGILAFGRSLREIRENANAAAPSYEEKTPALELRSCTACGKWVDPATTVRFPPDTYYCSNECVQKVMASAQ